MSEFFGQHLELIALISVSLAVVAGAIWASIYYAAYAVRSQFWGETVWHGTPQTNLVALTFDDGPSPDTEEILDVLKAANVKATFFLIGQNVEKYPEIAERIFRENHEIGNHSYSHPIFLFCTAGKTRRELEKTQEIIGEKIGITPQIARPPCGVRSLAYFEATKDLGLQTIQWSDCGFDWKKLSSRQIADKVLETTQSGSIILLHDGDSAGKSTRRPTAEALPLILRGLSEKGLRVAPLEDLI